MTETIQKAIDKIDKEAEKINNAYITSKVVQRIIEEKLTTDENANKILDSKKTLQGCIMFIYENAKSKDKRRLVVKVLLSAVKMKTYGAGYANITDLKIPICSRMQKVRGLTSLMHCKR